MRTAASLSGTFDPERLNSRSSARAYTFRFLK